MRIQSIKLANIRSYKSANITFPNGTVLLSGDIGCGKSTILLAIEFGLFGVLKGNFNGATLLRNGQKEGSVELVFEINNKTITLKRKLKKTKIGIAQDSGYIVIDGEKTEGTATELKTKVFELIGYPLENVSKAKNLIFRYTVYTPQEEMKSILLDSTNDRLDILRKVFGFDKYRRIVDNAIIVSRELKEKKREFLGMTADLNQKKDQEKKITNSIDEVKAKVARIKEPLEQLKKNVSEKEKELSESEHLKTKHQQLEKELAVLDTRLRAVVRKNSDLSTEQRRLGEEIIRLQSETINVPQEFDIDAKILSNRDKIKKIDERIYNLSKEMGGINVLSRESGKNDITGLDVCPTCKQTINETYKEQFKAMQEKQIQEITLKKQKVMAREKELKEIKIITNKELENLQAKKNAIILAKLKRKNFNEKKQRLIQIEKEQVSAKDEVRTINIKKIETNQEIKKIEPMLNAYKKVKEELDDLRKSERELSMSHNLLKQDYLRYNEQLDTLKEEIKTKVAILKRLDNMTTIISWLDETFKVMVSTMEKAVMSKVYTEFNDLFVQWFKEILEDETISVRLDEDFTPVITQNGYETDISNLSGGEKTSAALAYRLALNKVINDMMGNIKTRDILILDEPTDGFSGEQLDRLRDVLESLNIPQVIMVSHENKIESYVDNVIRITKNNHISRINT